MLSYFSQEQTLASSGTCLVKYHGIKPWREEGPKKGGVLEVFKKHVDVALQDIV